MKGDIVIVQAHHQKVARVIVPMIINNIREKKRVYTLTVGGESGCGKSEISLAIANELKENGINAIIFGQDDYFYLPPKLNSDKRRENPDWLGPHIEVNLDLLENNLIEAIQGKFETIKPLVDYNTNTIEMQAVSLKGIQVIIAEGTYTSLLKNIDIKIFITRNWHQTLEDRKKRSRGNEVYDPFTEEILAIEHKIIAGHRHLADIIVNDNYEVVNVVFESTGMKVKNQIQLITYPDSLGGDLHHLNDVLNKYFPGLFSGGIHILPPFPSSSDRGFAPLTYSEIESKFGTWDDIRQIGRKSPVMLDLMVNHISAQSSFFQDFLEMGRRSKYADLFITPEKIWPDGTPVKEDIDRIFLRRAEPFSKYPIRQTGESELVWTTFGKVNPSEQIDLDVHSPVTRELFTGFIANFGRNNIKMVRLDAVGYVIKKTGTSCFFVEPEIYEFLEWISNLAHSMNIEVVPEIHAEYETQFKLAQKGYWIYDFVLPYAILDAFINQTFIRLKQYLRVRPHHQFTMLDCHDGIPLKPDLNGLYRNEDAQRVIDICLERGANLSRVISPTHKDADGMDVHQIRGSYYSMLDCNDAAYLAARAIQFFTPGIPQVYYVGLMAGKNDNEAVERTGEGREINRHNYTLAEIDRETKKDVVKRLIALIKFRNAHPAFNGSFEVGVCDDQSIDLSWNDGDTFTKLVVGLCPLSATILYNEPGNKDIRTFNL